MSRALTGAQASLRVHKRRRRGFDTGGPQVAGQVSGGEAAHPPSRRRRRCQPDEPQEGSDEDQQVSDEGT